MDFSKKDASSRVPHNLARREMDELAKRAVAGISWRRVAGRRAAFCARCHRDRTQYSLGYYPTNKARDGKFTNYSGRGAGRAGQVARGAQEKVITLQRVNRRLQRRRVWQIFHFFHFKFSFIIAITAYNSPLTYRPPLHRKKTAYGRWEGRLKILSSRSH